jgi:hypothetical protein
MRITQGYNEGSHKSSYAIDDGDIDTGRSTAYAPYSGTVKVIYPQYENQVFFESDEPVLFADGTVDYAVTLVEHQNSPMAYGMALGKHYNQGEPFYVEGGRYAGVNNRVASHIHMEFAKGKYQKWYKNESGIYSLRDAKKPEDCCFIDNSYNILETWGYNFINLDTRVVVTPNVERDEYKNQIEVRVEKLRVRTEPTVNGKIIGFANIGFYNYYETLENEGYVWYKIADNQWIAYNEEWETIYPAKPKEEFIQLKVLDKKDGYVLVDLGKVWIKE